MSQNRIFDISISSPPVVQLEPPQGEDTFFISAVRDQALPAVILQLP